MSEADTQDLTVRDIEGRAVTLDDIAGDRPTLFVFVRHFG